MKPSGLLVRFVLWLLTHTFYRLRVLDRERIPATGGALLVANHMSFIDPGVILAAVDRPVRFLMYRDYYNLRWLKWLAQSFRAIPISAQDSPRDMIKSLKEASEAIKNGELVCVFAEGEITRTGQLLPFRKGLELIMKGVNAGSSPKCWPMRPRGRRANGARCRAKPASTPADPGRPPWPTARGAVPSILSDRVGG